MRAEHNAAQVRSSEWFRQTVAKDGEVFYSSYIPQAERTESDETAYFSSIMIRDFSNPDQFILVRAEYPRRAVQQHRPQ